MKKYKNLNRNSGVDAYDIGIDTVVVRFLDGSQYTYTYDSAGEHKIERMKELAEAGRGLNSYINTDVYYDYSDTTYRKTGGRKLTPHITPHRAPGTPVAKAPGSIGGAGQYAKSPFASPAPSASRRFVGTIGSRIGGFLFRRGEGGKKKAR